MGLRAHRELSNDDRHDVLVWYGPRSLPLLPHLLLPSLPPVNCSPLPLSLFLSGPSLLLLSSSFIQFPTLVILGSGLDAVLNLAPVKPEEEKKGGVGGGGGSKSPSPQGVINDEKFGIGGAASDLLE